MRELYIIEIPHQRKASVWTAYNESQFISIVKETYPEFYWEEITLESSNESGLIELLLPEHIKLLESGKTLIQYNDGHNTLYDLPENAPTEFECACDYNAHDLHSGKVLTKKEAELYVCDGHQSVLVNNLLKDELNKR